MLGIRRQNWRVRKRSTIILIAAAAAAVVIVVLLLSGKIFSVALGGGAARSLGKALPKNVIATANGDFLYSDGSNLTCLDRNGHHRWTSDLGMNGITTRASNDLILNYSGSNLQVMELAKVQLFSTSVDSLILEGAAGKEYVAVLIDAPREDTSAQQMIYMFDRTGQKTAQLSFNRQVIDFGFFSDETMTDLFWTLSLDTSGVAPISYITMYNKANGEMTYSITISARVVEDVFVTSNLIYANSAGLLSAYTYFGELQANFAVQGWRTGAVSTSETALCVAFVPRAEAAYIETVQTCRADGVSGTASIGSARFALPMDIIGVGVTQQKLYAFSSTTAYVYSLSGQLDKTLKLGTKISELKQVSNDCMVLWGDNTSYLMRLQ